MVPARLSSARDIRAAFAAGRSAVSRVAVVHVRSRGDESPARLAVVAGRKVGRAVDRNRAKRRLRAAARGLSWPLGHDAVVSARPAAVSAGYEELVTGLGAALARATGTPGGRTGDPRRAGGVIEGALL